MRTKQALDMAIVVCEVTGIILVSVLMRDTYQKAAIIIVTAAVAVAFAVQTVKDSHRSHYSLSGQVQGSAVSQIVLLGEEGGETVCWDIYGKAAVVFGRDEQDHKGAAESRIDIDLRDTAFAGSVDREHAVMNYYNDHWYLEDLESSNGVRVQKAGETAKYKISHGTPCQVGKGDIIYLGLTRLKVR